MSEGFNNIPMTDTEGNTLTAVQEIQDMVTKQTTSHNRPPSPPPPPSSAPTPGELLAMVAKLQKQVDQAQEENERLKSQQARGISVKASDKGGVSVYGIQRFPVTLYQDQWLRLFDEAEELVRSFISTHGKEGDKTLTEKPPKAGRPPQTA